MNNHLPPDPLAHPRAIRILLSETASRHLAEHGAACFAVVGRATYPADPKRWIVYLLPCSIEAANAATSVALGTRKASKIRPPKQ